MPSKSKVYFYRQGVSFRIKSPTALKSVIERLFRSEGKRLASMFYIFCSDEDLRIINRQFLGHDYYTDIVTFRLSDKKDPIEGESYISIDRIRENAETLGRPFSEELWRVVFHGALHLCGYNDKSTKAEKQIRKREDYYISIMT